MSNDNQRTSEKRLELRRFHLSAMRVTGLDALEPGAICRIYSSANVPQLIADCNSA
jgi:hypothetical protein